MNVISTEEKVFSETVLFSSICTAYTSSFIAETLTYPLYRYALTCVSKH